MMAWACPWPWAGGDEASGPDGVCPEGGMDGDQKENLGTLDKGVNEFRPTHHLPQVTHQATRGFG